jgi:hypothetical protein
VADQLPWTSFSVDPSRARPTMRGAPFPDTRQDARYR